MCHPIDLIAMIERPLILVASETPEALEGLDLNGEFHAAIAAAAGNPILEEMSERLLRKSAQVGFRHIVGAQDWAALQSEHRPILEAIKAHDPVAAREAMAHHFRVLRNRADASGRAEPAIPPR